MTIALGPKIPAFVSGAEGDTYWPQGNQLLRMLQALVQPNVVNLTTTAPPIAPNNGDTYVVAAGGTGAWAGHDNQIAYWTTDDPQVPAGKWEFWPPLNGWLVSDRSTNPPTIYQYNGATWAALSSGGGPNGVNVQTGDYTLQASDNGKLVVLTGSAPTLSLNTVFANKFVCSIVWLAAAPDAANTLTLSVGSGGSYGGNAGPFTLPITIDNPGLQLTSDGTTLWPWPQVGQPLTVAAKVTLTGGTGGFTTEWPTMIDSINDVFVAATHSSVSGTPGILSVTKSFPDGHTLQVNVTSSEAGDNSDVDVIVMTANVF